MKIERLLGILLYLINRDTVSASQLADHFNVSRRTIIRDINTLTLSGVPIYSDLGSKGGYTLNRDYRLNEKIIDSSNSGYILLALNSLKSVYGERKVHETYEKVKYIYSNGNDNDSLDIDFSVVNENRDVISSITTLREAIKQCKTVKFKYTNRDGVSRNVKCNVIHVFYKWYSWYAFSHDLEKNEYYMFKLVRIADSEVTEQCFDNTYDIEKLLSIYESKKIKERIDIIIEYSKEIEILVNEYFMGDIISESDVSIRKKVSIVENDFMIFSIILGFGDKLKVISPKTYQQRITEHLKRTLSKNYSNGDT